jgi:IS1 family transposase
METTGTIFYRKRVPAETIWQALKALAEGLDIRATARVFDVDPNTIEMWLHQAAEYMEAVSHYLIHDLHLSQVQVDELWALLGRQDTEGQSQQKCRAVRWVWAGIDPVSKLMLACVVGGRSVETAQLLIHLIVSLLAPGCIPLFLSDQWAPYATALLTHFGHWVPTPRRYPRGRRPKPRWQPLPGLQYAQVVKQRVKGRVVSVSCRVVYGSLEAIEAVLKQSGVGKVINTAFIERLNLTIRQSVAALGRKVISLAKTNAGLISQLSLWQAYYNFCLPHTSLRLLLPEPQPTKGNGSPKKWQQRTPAMAAGVADRVWRLEELLLFRVPPWRQPVAATV